VTAVTGSAGLRGDDQADPEKGGDKRGHGPRVDGEASRRHAGGAQEKRTRRLSLLAIVVLVLAAATVMQETTGWNQNSHYALTTSIAAGTPRIDPYRHWTDDKARFEGHWYSARAPGLALLSQPAYSALEFVRSPATAFSGTYGPERGALWALNLWAAILPAALILVVVRWLGDRVEPRLGASAAVALGTGTLLLPFSTMLFSHVLSAALVFAAFALLWHERAGRPRLPFVAVSGLLVGLGVTTEYPTAFAGAALGLYAIARRSGPSSGARTRLVDVVRRGLSYSAGVALGLVPLLAFNAWAFGSPTHLAYADLEQHQSGFFGVNLPNPAVMVELLGSSRGLLTLAPILALAVPGLVLLHRRGWRAEALTIAGIALAYLVFNAGYWQPFGGFSPGPRFLLTALPFLAVPLVLAFRRLPGPAIALTVVSSVVMAVATITNPLVASEADTGSWLPALLDRSFQRTVVSAAGIGGAWAILPFVVGLAGALLLAAAVAAADRKALPSSQVVLGALAAIGWTSFAVFGPTVLGIDASARTRLGYSEPPEAIPFPLLELALLALAAALSGLALAACASRVRCARGLRDSEAQEAGTTRGWLHPSQLMDGGPRDRDRRRF
jgi:hypothetical protein